LAEISTGSIRLEVKQAEAALAVAGSQLRKVEKGSRPEEIRIAEAALTQAEANLEEVERNFKRIKDLHQDHAVSNSEYDSAKMAMEAAQAAAESARQQFELAKQGPRTEDRDAARAGFHQAQSALAIARDRLRKSRLRSPCDCIVAFRHVEKGEVVGPGTVITQVVDKSKMKIKLSLAEKDLLLVEKDKQLSFAIDALPGEAFTCQLTFLSPTADPVTRSFPLELAVDKPDPRMADGMTVRVQFPFTDPKMSIKVPSAWLSEESGQMGLFVVKEEKAVFKKVALGSYYEQKVEILSGLSDNDLVITNPAGLKSGDEVKY
jgi:multidrug efflux pump subunit AcrA (membrane-fusion protein)